MKQHDPQQSKFNENFFQLYLITKFVCHNNNPQLHFRATLRGGSALTSRIKLYFYEGEKKKETIIKESILQEKTFVILLITSFAV